MVLFLIVILLLGAALEALSMRDALQQMDFEYKPSTTRLEPGESFEMVATVANRSRIPASYVQADISYPLVAELAEGVEYTENRFVKTVGTVFRLWGLQKLTRSMKLSISKRGVHFVEGAILKRGDFLGITETFRAFEERKEVLVYPKASENAALNEALGNYCGDLIAQRWLIRDPIITLGVREYTGREPMHTISWSQSARRGDLMVREFDYTKELSCAILLSANGIDPMKPELFDTCCSIARTVVETLTDKGINVALHTSAALWGYNSTGVWTCEAAKNRLSDALETLARVYPASRCSAMELVSSCARASADGTAYIFIVPHANNQILDAADALRAMGNTQVTVIAADELEEAES